MMRARVRRDLLSEAAVLGRNATDKSTKGDSMSGSTLLGSPILGALLLMEASGLGGPTLTLVLIPGLLAAGWER
jgi:hypothetical protein